MAIASTDFMARILDVFLDRKTNRNCEKYTDEGSLFTGLSREETDAIRCLSARTSGSIFNIGKKHQLSEDDIEELICDCITICLQKIKAGTYTFQGYNLATFVIEIAKNRARNFRRSALKHDTMELDEVGDLSERGDDALVVG